MGRGVFDQELHLVDELAVDVAVGALSLARSIQVFAALGNFALRAHCLDDFFGIFLRVKAVGGEADLVGVALLQFFWDALIIKEEVLQLEEGHLSVRTVFLVGIYDLSEDYRGHNHFVRVFQDHLILVGLVLDETLQVLDNLHMRHEPEHVGKVLGNDHVALTCCILADAPHPENFAFFDVD